MGDGAKTAAAGLLDFGQAAEYLGVTISTLRWLRRTNRLPGTFRLGRKLRIRREDLDKWVERQAERGQNLRCQTPTLSGTERGRL